MSGFGEALGRVSAAVGSVAGTRERRGKCGGWWWGREGRRKREGEEEEGGGLCGCGRREFANLNVCDSSSHDTKAKKRMYV